MNLSQYVLEPLRVDEEFVLYRAEHSSERGLPSALVLAPASKTPTADDPGKDRARTGSLPFTAVDPMEWVHCHIARQAMPPSVRVPHVAAPVSAIIMKLLAKTAEERYQTVAGLER